MIAKKLRLVFDRVVQEGIGDREGELSTSSLAGLNINC